MDILKTNNLELVDLRLYEDNLVEVDDEMPKAIVSYRKEDGMYHNIFNFNESYPLLKRLPYTNTTFDGVDFGTKLQILDKSQIEDKGICGIICSSEYIKKLKEQDYITLKEIEDFIINSPLYFKDRIYIIKKRTLYKRKINHKLKKIIIEDSDKNVHYEKQLERLSRKKRLIRR